MFRHVYGLNHNPFDKGIATVNAFKTADFTECSARLDYLTKSHGLGLITAASGYGKTFAVRAFAERQNPNLVMPLYLCLSTVSPSEFYRQLSGALGLEAPFRKADMFKIIKEHMEYMALSKKIHCIVILDEAQYLSSAILKDLKMLLNFSYDSKDCFSLVLLGQPVLADVLSLQANEALRQRISVNYEFGGLRESEAIDYAKSMLSCAGGSDMLYDEAALRAAYASSAGSVRTYNHILTKALTIGAQIKAPSIDAEMVMSAANEMAIR
jgi:type II secretory pathway predicted ATPase ExeA